MRRIYVLKGEGYPKAGEVIHAEILFERRKKWWQRRKKDEPILVRRENQRVRVLQ